MVSDGGHGSARRRLSTIGACRRWGADQLDMSPTPMLDARLLMGSLLGLDDGALIARDTDLLSSDLVAAYRQHIERRRTGEPVAYITGEKEFWGRKYCVTRDTLIPRPDSETLIAAALETGISPRTILDLGTGTGCLLGALIEEFPDAYGVGIEVSPGAASLAQSNMRRHGWSRRTHIVVGDWLASISGKFDLIVTNPPYIVFSDHDMLPISVRSFEPHLALFAGKAGLSAYETILNQIGNHMNRESVLIIEIGDGQSDPLRALAKTMFPTRKHRIRGDLNGRDRALIIDGSGGPGDMDKRRS